MLLPKVLGMESDVQSELELIIRARIKKFWIPNQNANLDFFEDKIENLLRFSVCKLQPRAFDDQGHASSEQQLKILQ